MHETSRSKRVMHVHTLPYPYLNGYLHIGHALQLVKTGLRHQYLQSFGPTTSKFYVSFHATGIPIPIAVAMMQRGDPRVLKSFRMRGAKPLAPATCDAWITHHMAAAMSDIRALELNIDWSGTFTTTPLEPIYDSLVKWQYDTLREMGYCVQKAHHIIWCEGESCNSPLGDHERATGEGRGLESLDLNVYNCVETGQKCLAFTTPTGGEAYGLIDLKGGSFFISTSDYKKLHNVMHWATMTGPHTRFDMAQNFQWVRLFQRVPCFTGSITCRCGQAATVKTIENQWFLRYSDADWRVRILKAINELDASERIVRQLRNRLAALDDYPFTRSAGLGTRPSFDPGHTIGPLSDSTIYPALHVLMGAIRSASVKPSGIHWSQIFGEHEATDPLHARLRSMFLSQPITTWHMTGKDLVDNHILFMIAHFIIFFPGRRLPRIKVTGHVLAQSGAKMSKSRGNCTYLHQLVAHAESSNAIAGLKLNIAMLEDGLHDMRYNPSNTGKYQNKLDRLMDSMRHTGNERYASSLMKFLLHQYALKCHGLMLRGEIRQSFQNMLFELPKLNHYFSEKFDYEVFQVQKPYLYSLRMPVGPCVKPQGVYHERLLNILLKLLRDFNGVVKSGLIIEISQGFKQMIAAAGIFEMLMGHLHRPLTINPTLRAYYRLTFTGKVEQQ